MNLQGFLHRIKFQGTARPDLETLNEIQRCILLNVPYENLDVIMGKKIVLDLKILYDKIVSSGRGGWCHEMNGLLFWVLKEIGFSINMVNCTAWTNEKWSANFGHMGLVVDLEQKQFFVDVGWGDHRAHVFPLEIVLDKPVTQASGDYKFVVVDGFHQLVRKRTDEPDENANWKIIHKFKILSQVLEDFNGACDFFHRPGSDDVLPHVPVVLAKTGDGSGTIALIANKFRTYKNCHSLEREAVEKESDISEERFRELLKERFGMVLPSEAKFIPGWEGSGYKTSFLTKT